MRIYTVGHSNHPLDLFLSLLARHGVQMLADVRSHPYSKRVGHFQKDRLARSLRGHAIGYVFLGRELGGRPRAKAFYDAQGKLDDVRRRSASDFLSGIGKLKAFAIRRPTAILCAEEDPNGCHRKRLITPALESRGIEVIHIRSDGRLEPEAEWPPRSAQMPLFEVKGETSSRLS